jgi:transposase-like protein
VDTKSLVLSDLVESFSCEDTCNQLVEELRWPDGVRCIRCESPKISRIAKRRQFDCDACGYQFSVRAGTIFHDSKLPLSKWFLAIYIMIESKKGISANQMKRMLKVSYKTAWYLCHRIRAAMKDEGGEMLRGIVEADETFVGGKRRGVGSGNRVGKSVLLAAVERGGKMRAAVTKDRKKVTIHEFLRKNVHGDTEAIYTDNLSSYHGIADHNTKHGVVKHERMEWVNGQVHTNTVEGVFSLLKRSIVGSYHKVSTKHLQAYVEEMAWKYNNRKNPFLFRDTMLELIRSPRLEYRELVGGD